MNIGPLVMGLRDVYGEYIHEIIPVDDNSTVRITVEYSQPRPPTPSSDSDKGKSDQPTECAEVETEPDSNAQPNAALPHQSRIVLLR